MNEHPGWEIAKPMSFTAPMMRAIIGRHKSETRRLPKVQPVSGVRVSPFVPSGIEDGHGHEVKIAHPAGSFIYCRERHCALADGGFAYESDGPGRGGLWRTSFLMPRAASRVLLEVKRARVERLSMIDKDGVLCEGISRDTKDEGLTWKFGIPDFDGLPGSCDIGWPWREWESDPVKAYLKLWDQIHGKKTPSSSDPWVIVYTFEIADLRGDVKDVRIEKLLNALKASVEASKRRGRRDA